MSSCSISFSPRIFFAKIRRTISEFQMLKKDDSVLVGVSGGPDSIALIHAFVELSKTWPMRVGVAHLNHGLRGTESDDDAEFVISLANSLHLPCHVENINLSRKYSTTRSSLEEAGREARYKFFNEMAVREGFDKIAVGHNRDDNAELILINLIRGSGMSGLKGIPPVRGKIIRPLICASRELILSYLNHYQLNYRIDSSNSDERFIRNKIRHHLIPLLKLQYNPKISDALNRLGEILSTEEEWLSQVIDQAMEQCVQSKSIHNIILSIDKLQTFHIAAQKRVIRSAVRHVKGDLRRISYSHVDAVTDLLKSNAQNLSLDLPENIRIFKQNGQLRLSKEKKSLRAIGHSEKVNISLCFEYTISALDILCKPLIIKEAELGLKFDKLNIGTVRDLNKASRDMAYFDWDCLNFPLKVRNYRAGDFFIPLGMTGRQSLKKFFVNNKINKLKRSRIPMIISEDKIVWVVGERISDPYKVTPETKTVLCVKLFLLQKDHEAG
jgi:tRNA(Ile)-lysidine synthase